MFTKLLAKSILKTAAEFYAKNVYPASEHMKDLNELVDLINITGDTNLQKLLKYKLRSFKETNPEAYTSFMAPYMSDRALLDYYLMTGDKSAVKELIKHHKYEAKKIRQLKRQLWEKSPNMRLNVGQAMQALGTAIKSIF
ncbi:MAG: hypothetical protein QXE80_03510 [Pyrobaculum sp.]